VWGGTDLATFLHNAERINLNGVVDQITCPFRITHGTNDRQINVDYGHQSYDQAVHAPKKDLRLFTRTRAAPSTSASTTSRTSVPTPPTGSRTP
jgi:hypothetical protein